MRTAIIITGMVQGVGFRPFVYRLAMRHKLRGFVKNQMGGVRVEVEGSDAAVDGFLGELPSSKPPMARIDSMRIETLAPGNDADFQIIASEGGAVAEDFVPPDVGICAECLEELFDPGNRRWRYPFITCMNCGPRLTLIQAMPYDRERTTMAAFPLCPLCRAEYENPANRRFHAETTCCAACGPRLQLLDGAGRPIEVDDPIERVAEEILAGRIGALKGLGGFHLACDARNEGAVAELRRRKMRDEKPFAIMAADLDETAKLCESGEDEKRLLNSPRRPIVLLRKRAGAGVAESVAPGNPWLGVMLPYTPLHCLLLRQAGIPLVMTSGNGRDDPIVYQNAWMREKLGGLADFVLTHNRAIESRCDDSVMRASGGRERPLRRARGYSPAPIPLPAECPFPILALGGQMKSVFALGRGARAIVSHHLGELDHPEAFRGFTEALERYERLFRFEPEWLVHDLHPDYASTIYAAERARRDGLHCVAAQHHHAHIASCMVEHGLTKPVIGVAFDGTGLGTDGTVWGGEFLVADYNSFERAAHFRCVAMPGGEAAIRQPWRMGFVHLRDAGESTAEMCEGISPRALSVLARMAEAGINSPRTSSCGRLFDAVAAMLGVRRRAVSYEGQAAIELEWLALQTAGDKSYPFTLESGAPMVIDTRPIIASVARDLRDGTAKNKIARRFHSTICELTARVCIELRQKFRVNEVALSGGVFMNSALAQELPARLAREKFNVFQHAQVPPNDGGLCLGQLAIAAAATRKPLTASEELIP
ncbi:MAG TPA: carbamoyltransferase HypF [Verrucomicrobiae bacterium]|jgi:hydrogenase maturation protein HypF